MPGPSGPQKYEGTEAFEKMLQQGVQQLERSLSNLDWESAISSFKSKYPQFEFEATPGGDASTPFRLYEYNDKGKEVLIPPQLWKEKLPPEIYAEVKDMRDVIFDAPVHEVPSYWRQVNPDLYKEELAGYLEEQPGYVHEMSSEMS